MNRFVLSRPARRDLAEIRDYLSSREDRTTAERMLDRFERAFRLLAQMPGVGHFREDLTPRRMPMYWWPVGSYTVIYRRVVNGPETVQVIRVLHQARDIPRLLDDDAA